MKPKGIIKPGTLILLLLLALLLSSCQTGIKKISLQSSKITETPAAQESSETEQEAGKVTKHCPVPDPHPVAEDIAQKYDFAYEQITEWYCAGFSFEDILLALQTSQVAEVDPENLLARLKHQNWDQIWDDFDLNP